MAAILKYNNKHDFIITNNTGICFDEKFINKGIHNTQKGTQLSQIKENLNDNDSETDLDLSRRFLYSL